MFMNMFQNDSWTSNLGVFKRIGSYTNENTRYIILKMSSHVKVCEENWESILELVKLGLLMMNQWKGHQGVFNITFFQTVKLIPTFKISCNLEKH